MNETTGDSGDEKLIGDEKLNDAVELFTARFEHGIEFLGLRNGPREAVQYKSGRHIRTDANKQK